MTEPPKLRISEAGTDVVRRKLDELEAFVEAEREARLAALHRRIVITLGLAADCPSARGGS
jgi:hypothetical protein